MCKIFVALIPNNCSDHNIPVSIDTNILHVHNTNINLQICTIPNINCKFIMSQYKSHQTFKLAIKYSSSVKISPLKSFYLTKVSNKSISTSDNLAVIIYIKTAGTLSCISLKLLVHCLVSLKLLVYL